MKSPIIVLAAFALTGLAAGAPAQSGIDYDESGFRFETPAIVQTLPNLTYRMGREESIANTGYTRMRGDYGPDDRGPAYDALTLQTVWEVAGANEKLLSLAASGYRYSGGAHGGTFHEALLWDVEGDREIMFHQLFSDRYAALSLIDAQFCPLLRQIQISRGVISEDSEPDAGPFDFGWNRCPFYDEITIAPASDREAGPFTHFNIVVGEYVAGPYAVGTFDATVAVTPEIIALARPEYRDNFGVMTPSADQQ